MRFDHFKAFWTLKIAFIFFYQTNTIFFKQAFLVLKTFLSFSNAIPNKPLTGKMEIHKY
jgi:hypothetical protein